MFELVAKRFSAPIRKRKIKKFSKRAFSLLIVISIVSGLLTTPVSSLADAQHPPEGGQNAGNIQVIEKGPYPGEPPAEGGLTETGEPPMEDGLTVTGGPPAEGAPTVIGSPSIIGGPGAIDEPPAIGGLPIANVPPAANDPPVAGGPTVIGGPLATGGPPAHLHLFTDF